MFDLFAWHYIILPSEIPKWALWVFVALLVCLGACDGKLCFAPVGEQKQLAWLGKLLGADKIWLEPNVPLIPCKSKLPAHAPCMYNDACSYPFAFFIQNPFYNAWNKKDLICRAVLRLWAMSLCTGTPSRARNSLDTLDRCTNHLFFECLDNGNIVCLI
jgi:hypothetical protein